MGPLAPPALSAQVQIGEGWVHATIRYPRFMSMSLCFQHDTASSVDGQRCRLRVVVASVDVHSIRLFSREVVHDMAPMLAPSASNQSNPTSLRGTP